MADEIPVIVNSLLDRAKKVVTDPAGFFSTMSKTGGFTDPIIFLAVMGVASALVQIILGFIGMGGIGMMAVTGLIAIVIVPVFVVIGGFISAFFIYLFWRMMGSEENYETSFRCVAYIAAIAPITAVFRAVPYLGGVASTVWGMLLLIIASVAVHGIARQKAQLWFGISAAILILFGLSGEYAARNVMTEFEGFQQQYGEDLQNKSPEEMGRVMGEFMKGLEAGSKE